MSPVRENEAVLDWTLSVFSNNYTLVLFFASLVSLAWLLQLWIRRRRSAGMMGREYGSSDTVSEPNLEEVHTGSKAADCPVPAARVQFEAFAPPSIQKGQPFVLDLHLFQSRDRVRILQDMPADASSVGATAVPRLGSNCTITFHLVPRYLQTNPSAWFHKYSSIHEHRDWSGQPVRVQLEVMCPKSVKYDEIHERIVITADGMFIGDCMLTIPFNGITRISSRFETVRSIFASYSSVDRIEVLARLQMLHKLLEVDIFLDVDTLRSGEKWEARLIREINRRDRFFLFWSRNAAASEWVEREWRLALRQRGIDYIEPVPLEFIKAPVELRKLHFNDRYLMLASAEKERAKQGTD